MGGNPSGLDLPAELLREIFQPMSLDRLELVSVQLGSGKVYLLPRAILENLVNALPVSAPQLIVSVSASGGPLDPSGLPSGAGAGASRSCHRNSIKTQGALVF